MIGNRLIRFVTLICVFACCSFSVFAQELIFPEGNGVFPELLGDLTWKYDEKLLKKRLLGSELQDAKYGDDEVDSVYTKITLPLFGDAMIDVDHDDSGVIRFIYITAIETRRQCAPENINRPPTCRNKYGKVLIGIRNKLVSYIESKYGKGVATPRCEETKNTRICENSFAWTTTNAKLHLGIYTQEDGSWNVSLHIMNTKVPKPN